MFLPRFIGFVLIILWLALFRVIPHPMNFTPIGAAALFAGAKFMDKRSAILLLLLSMFFTDLYLGLYHSIIFTYLGIISMIFMGTLLPEKAKLSNIVATVVAGSLTFYIISNFGVWLLSGGYDYSINGLVSCFILAIPFLKNTLMSTLLYSLLFFFIFYFIEHKDSSESASENSFVPNTETPCCA